MAWIFEIEGVKNRVSINEELVVHGANFSKQNG